MRNTILIIIAGLLMSGTAQGEEVLTLSTGEYPPGYSQHAEGYGYVNHIVSEAFAQVGIRTEYKFLPWKRAYDRTKKSHFIGSCCWFLNKQDRIDNFYHSEPIHTRGFWFFHLASHDFDWKALADLETIRIGGLSGAAYTEEFDGQVKAGKLKLMQLDTVEQGLRMLLKRRMDVCLLDRETGYAVIRKMGDAMTGKFRHHEKSLIETPTHILFSKSDAEKSMRYRDLFNQGLEKLKQSGSYEQILTDLAEGKYEVRKGKEE